MHGSRLGGVIIDCRTDDLEREARFWSQALGYSVRGASDPGEGDFISLKTPPGEPYIEVQSVDHPSRVHLDIKTDDLEAEVERLERLGAKRVEKVEYWWVMEAPSGHRFCVIPLHPGQEVGKLNEWDE
ncbi:MAG: VOC family protein [Thermodesulfobacteriota bacterium]